MSLASLALAGRIFTHLTYTYSSRFFKHEKVIWQDGTRHLTKMQMSDSETCANFSQLDNFCQEIWSLFQ